MTQSEVPMNERCWYCDRELFFAKKEHRERFFCDKYCRLEHEKKIHGEKKRKMKMYKCVVCLSSIADPEYKWFCSHDCHLKYQENPSAYCKNCTRESRYQTTYVERRYIWAATHGAHKEDEGIITTCCNQDCINIDHMKLVSKAETRRFWGNLRSKRIKKETGNKSVIRK